MLKPSDIKLTVKTNPGHLIAIEEHIDEALRGVTSWPLVVDMPRAGWSPDEINVVLTKYRDAGWAVQGDSRRHAMCAIMPASDLANRDDELLTLALKAPTR